MCMCPYTKRFNVFSYYMLRRKVSNTCVLNFFITNTGNPVTKFFDHLNLECVNRNIRLPGKDGRPGEILKINAGLIRKQLETAVSGEYDAAIKTQIAARLDHTEDTAKRHYYIPTGESSRMQQRAVTSVTQTSGMKEYILLKSY